MLGAISDFGAYGMLIMPVSWMLTVVLVIAAIIDGWKFRVPNWLTFPLILSGWGCSWAIFGWPGLWASLQGTAVGLGLLLPAYAIGGMGAGDVKLLAGVGAWLGMRDTLWAFVVSAIVGAVLAVGMALYRGNWRHHQQQLVEILREIMIIRNPEELAARAAERKPQMLLLPYGIPIALGTIGYFVYAGMLL
ncbi:MAG: A24 family peptidase [Thermoguttaceae bacterium]|nr:A24 family peptidase [Thermoguttaceae bacterium]MDW8036796.1 A24 family peptidase [Thermoguttaceae bacterium]